MNTPYPCGNCVHCYYNPITEDDPSISAECMIESPNWGNKDCPDFILYDLTALFPISSTEYL
jgi:hypothetical protein